MIAALSVALLAAATAMPFENLRTVSLPQTTIVTADLVPAGPFVQPAPAGGRGGAPATPAAPAGGGGANAAQGGRGAPAGAQAGRGAAPPGRGAAAGGRGAPPA